MYRTAIAAVALLLPLQLAQAGTLEQRLSLGVDEDRTIPVSQVARVHSSDPQVVDAQLPEEEKLRVKGRSPGTAFVFLHTELGVSVFRVDVDTAPTEDREQAVSRAEAACESFQQTRDGFEVSIGSPACHEAIVGLGHHLLSSELVVRFDERGLRAQLTAQQARLLEDHEDAAQEIDLAYLGATLRLSGSVESEERRDAILRSLWHATAGRMLVDLRRLRIDSADAETR